MDSYSVDDLNRVEFKTVRTIIGERGMTHLERILDHLFRTLPVRLKGNPKPPVPLGHFQFRYAPSIVTRNEAELFGISSPRFAIRGSESCGIFNLRRLDNLEKAVGEKWSERLASKPIPQILREPNYPETPAQKFTTNRCIADALIIAGVAELQSDGFRVLTTNLGIPYGEGLPLTGVPYVEHITLGGGLCAQASCLMCTLLLHDFSLGVHGAAEITALTKISDTDSDNQSSEVEEFALSGMKPIEIVSYFRSSSVRMASSIELADEGYFNEATPRFTMEGLFAYVRSGLPVIIPVDAGRMEAPILKPNKIPYAEPVSGTVRNRSHAIVAVAAKRLKKTEGADQNSLADLEFAVNDPLRCPLLLANGNQLVESRAYYFDNDAVEEAVPPDRNSGSQQSPVRTLKLAPFQFISVRPAEVRFPLLSVESIESTEASKAGQESSSQETSGPRVPNKRRLGGLFSMAYRLLTKTVLTERLGIPLLTRAEADQILPGVVRLAVLSSESLSEKLSAFAIESLVDLPEGHRALIENWSFQCGLRQQWVWIQWIVCGSGEELLLIWNAEVPEDITAAIDRPDSRFVLAAFSRKGLRDQWNNSWTASPVPPKCSDDSNPQRHDATDLEIPEWTEGPLLAPDRCLLKPAVISSFGIPTFQNVVSNWPMNADQSPIACELYAFMKPTDGSSWTGAGMPGATWRSATEEMAGIVDDPHAFAKVIQEFQENLKANGQTIPVVALASFFPEVTCPQDDDRWKMAKKAIRFMLKLGDHFAGLNADKPKIVIEMVAGSRIDGLWPGKDLREPDIHFYANRMTKAEGIRRLLDCIQQALRESIPSPEQSRVAIALELEPGPLYLLNSFKAMQSIQKEIERRQDPFLDQLVGYNLDIAHWKMAGINPAWLLDPAHSSIARRIFHGHLSGHHSRAHLGDTPLVPKIGYGVRQSTVEWIRLLGKLSGRQIFSNPLHVSLEYEAAKNVDFLRQSVLNLEWALRVADRAQDLCIE